MYELWNRKTFIRIHRDDCVKAKANRIIDEDSERPMKLDCEYETLAEAEAAAKLKANRVRKCLLCCEVDDLEFLHEHLDNLAEIHETVQELTDSDFNRSLDPPKSTPDQERCANLADDHGIDGNLFRGHVRHTDSKMALRNLRQQIDTIPQIIRAVKKQRTIETTPAALPAPIALSAIETIAHEPELFVPSDKDLELLRYLETQTKSKGHEDIAAAVDSDRKTVGKWLKDLRKHGFVFRPRGTNGGEAITELGRQLLASQKT